MVVLGTSNAKIILIGRKSPEPSGYFDIHVIIHNLGRKGPLLKDE